ncbi:FMN-binding negative transcriptional regulator [Mangrovivirga sp. M17]|uniref:FMN-binding negative transcriptional regulator n=1 Tax=Mangrovivirga halotolerans TaxID=2993936 RepID=A0ABT3RSV1_9BACT|nr:FMN-binding negative transcriptional regulator [Mangrovivirga halotolerans]MCX2744220.1 FMN-binding negative transcriptional regulator [Mangrovivirga halotolerans]
MKYPPKHYSESSMAMSLKVMRLFPLATVITSNTDSLPDVTLMPLLVDQISDRMVLLGHIDNNNPQTSALKGGEVKILFKGPDTYISPLNYVSENQLPTWNYAYVEIAGRAEFISDEECRNLLVRMADELDTRDWKLDYNDPRIDRLLPFIQGFKITITRIKNRFKLSQDKSPEDQEAVNQVMMEDTRMKNFVTDLKEIIP